MSYSTFTTTKPLLTAFCFMLATIIAVPANALPQHWELDLSHSRVGFAVEHLGFSTVMGRFHDVTGSLYYDIKHPDKTRMRFSIETDSIDTGWSARDEHLQGQDFFNSEKYPRMDFVSTHVKFLNPQQAQVTGDLTLLGQTHPITLAVTLKKIGTSPINQEPVIGFRATATIDRTAYGMNAYAKGISTQVPIQIDGELVSIKML